MKKLLLSLATIATCITVQAGTIEEVLTVGNFKNVTESYTSDSYTSVKTGITYAGQLAKDGEAMQIRSKNSDSGIVITKNENGYKLKSIEIVVNDKTVSTRTLDVYGKNDAYTNPTDLYNSSKSGDIIGTTNGSASLTSTDGYVFIGLRSHDGAMYIDKITITYDDGQGESGLKSAGLSFNPTTFSVNVGETLAGPALTTAEGFDGKVVYTSGDETIATVDAETGEVTGVAAGTTTISAKSDATATFDKGSASYTLTVIDPNDPTSASVDLVFECGQSTGNQISGTNMTKIDYMIASESKSLVSSLSGASNLLGGVQKSVRFGSYSNGSYKQGALTITLKGAYKITSIDVTIKTYKSTNNKAPKNPTWNLDINGHQMVETLTSDVETATAYNIPFETVALADESAANTLTIKSTDAPVDVYSLKINYEPTSTGVNDIIADDANAPVEYFNLQGVRVMNPTKGIYIRKYGSKVTKVCL